MQDNKSRLSTFAGQRDTVQIVRSFEETGYISNSGGGTQKNKGLSWVFHEQANS